MRRGYKRRGYMRREREVVIREEAIR